MAAGNSGNMFWWRKRPGAEWHAFSKQDIKTGDSALCGLKFDGEQATGTPHFSMILGADHKWCERCHSLAFGNP
jgi:hypothetical protein